MVPAARSAAQESEPEEHPDTVRMRKLSACFGTGWAIIDQATGQPVRLETLSDLADALPDPDEREEPERAIDGTAVYERDYVVAPGETLLETLGALGMNEAELAKRTGRPLKTINQIITGKAAITPEIALQLERLLDVPARIWNNLEAHYQETRARLNAEGSKLIESEQ